MENTHVLIVEDDLTTQQLARIVLEDAGYTVSAVRSAEDAIRRLANFTPDIMLIDRGLPGMDGLELTRIIRDDPRTREVIVLSFTSRTGVTDNSLAVEAGADGFVHKPFDMHTLVSTAGWYVAERANRRRRRASHGAETSQHDKPGNDVRRYMTAYNAVQLTQEKR